MSVAKDPVDQFRKTARSLAAASGFDQLKIGLVYYRANPWVLGMRVELARPGAPGGPEDLPVVETPNFRASQTRMPLDDLEPLLDKVQSGGGLWLPGLPPGLTLSLRPTDRKADPWFQASRPLDQRRAAVLTFRGPSLEEIGISSFEDADEEIRACSSYQWSSLSRLVRGFCDQRFEQPRDSTEVELIAPWPLGTLNAVRAGAQIKLHLVAITGLSLERLIVNLEGAGRDLRVAPERLHWEITDYDGGLSTYDCSFEPEIGAFAVNVFVDGAPQVVSHSDVSNEPALPGLTSWPPSREPTFESTPAWRLASSDLRLVTIEARGYRALTDVKLSLTPLTVVVGPNQAGKSTLLDCIGFLSEAARGNLGEAIRTRGGFASIVHREGGKPLKTFSLAAELSSADGGSYRYDVEVTGLARGGYELEREKLVTVQSGVTRTLAEIVRGEGVIGGRRVQEIGLRELALSQVRDPANLPEWDGIRSALASCALYGNFDTAPVVRRVDVESVRGPSRLDPEVQLGHRGENLSAALYAIKETRPEDWELLLGATRLAFPRLRELRFPAHVVRGAVHLRWVEQDREFDPYELSDGSLSFLAAACALVQADAALIAIDEPEQHLHPDAIQRILGLAETFSERHQILLATQSSHLIGLLDETPDSLVIAQPADGGSRLFRPDPKMLQAWLREFSLGSIRPELETWSAE